MRSSFFCFFRPRSLAPMRNAKLHRQTFETRWDGWIQSAPKRLRWLRAPENGCAPFRDQKAFLRNSGIACSDLSREPDTRSVATPAALHPSRVAAHSIWRPRLKEHSHAKTDSVL